MKTVTKIPPKRNPLTFAPLEKVEKRRVAAYARVSTDSDEQKTSYDAQVDYYTKYIKEKVTGSLSVSIQMKEFQRPIQNTVTALTE